MTRLFQRGDRLRNLGYPGLLANYSATPRWGSELMGDQAVDPPGRGVSRLSAWKLWTLPVHVVVYILVVEFAALVAAVWSSVGSTPTREHWLLCAALGVSAGIHMQLSTRIERVRHDHSHSPHVDLCTIWIFGGALLLPPLLATLLAMGIYVHRWWLVIRWDASRPPHRIIFTAATMVLAALAVVGIVSVSGLRDVLLEPRTVDWLHGSVVLAAIAVQWTVNSILIAVVVMLSSRRSWKDAIGSTTDNLLELGQLVLGAFVAFTVGRWLGFPLLMVVPVVALHQTVLLHQLKLAARIDDKTGLLNATTWHGQAEIELQRARQEHRTVGLFMLDLDLFSTVNNRYGHLTGDAVLQRFAHLLSSTVRRGDSVGRFGGEEFAVLLPGVTRREALAVAQRIRTRLHDVHVPDGAGGDITGLTVSIGIAIYPEVAEDTATSLIAAADAALYEAKKLGRDQIHFAGERRSLPWLPSGRRVTDDAEVHTDVE